MFYFDRNAHWPAAARREKGGSTRVLHSSCTFFLAPLSFFPHSGFRLCLRDVGGP